MTDSARNVTNRQGFVVPSEGGDWPSTPVENTLLRLYVVDGHRARGRCISNNVWILLAATGDGAEGAMRILELTQLPNFLVGHQVLEVETVVPRKEEVAT